MSIIWRSLKANAYKMYHSKLLWVHLLIPLAAAVIFNLYFPMASWAELDAAKLYIQAVAIAFPLMIAIVTTLVYEADAEAGNFGMFHTLSDRKAKGHIGNLLALLLFGSVACALAVMGFGLLFRGGAALMGNVSEGLMSSGDMLPMSSYVEISGLLFSVHIVSYLLQYMLCYTFGKGVSLGAGIVGLLLSPLLYLGIGDRIWKWIPCSYGIRMASYDFILKTSHLDAALDSVRHAKDNGYWAEHSEYLVAYAQEELKVGFWTIAGATVLMGIVFYLWGNKWESSGSTGE